MFTGRGGSAGLPKPARWADRGRGWRRQLSSQGRYRWRWCHICSTKGSWCLCRPLDRCGPLLLYHLNKTDGTIFMALLQTWAPCSSSVKRQIHVCALAEGRLHLCTPLGSCGFLLRSVLLYTQRACQNSRQAIVNRLSCIAHVVGQEEQLLPENHPPIGRASSKTAT